MGAISIILYVVFLFYGSKRLIGWRERMDSFEMKKHYKMYKAGKNWVVAPLITVGVVTGIVMGTSLSMADEVSVNNEDTKVVQSEKNLNFDNNSIYDKDEILTNNNNNDKKEIEKTAEIADNTNDEKVTRNSVAPSDTSMVQADTDNIADKAIGEQKIDGHWYLFNDQGEMQRGIQDLRPYGSEKHAYYNEAGQMQYGWQRVNDEPHYFDTYDGAMAVGEKNINDHWYLFDKEGNMQRGIQDLRPYGAEKHAYYNEDGWMQYGWQRINDEPHYFDTYDGAMAVGEKNINGHWYLFDKEGNMQRGIQDLRPYGAEKHAYYNEDGWMQYGWQWVNNATHYFDTYDGAMAVGEKQINGHWYLFNDQGEMQRGLQYLPKENKLVLYNNDGWMQYGEHAVNDKKYYFDTFNGALKATGLNNISDHWFLFGKTGDLLTGEQEVNGEKLFFDKDTAQLKTGMQKIGSNIVYVDPKTASYKKNFLFNDDGKWYYFDSQTGIGSEKQPNSYILADLSVSDDYRNGNVLYSHEGENIENVDGYLTADSWYRPKEILDNGENWRLSTTNDKRPLLMVWWPNKEVKVNYLNFMADKGLLRQNNFSTSDDSKKLQSAAEEVQKNIEKKISAENGKTEWLRENLSDFIATQPMWNRESEDPAYFGFQFQGGFLKYVNNELVPETASDWRLMGRQPINIDGKGEQGAEFLLANDIDNSNPIVQAEQLNWLHYLLNFGNITANDSQANFDGIRIDAVDNVDADLLSIAGDYMRAAYGTSENDANANKHLSILEDWNINDAGYTKKIGTPQISIDNHTVTQITASLSKQQGGNDRMGRFLEWYMVDRSNDDSENVAIPSFAFVRAHDYAVQDMVQQATTDATGAEANHSNWDQLAKGLALYNADQAKTVKKYNRYNIPSSYALLLTNKDSIPRVYYGDVFTDGGQYMSQKSIYYDIIDNLLRSRVKYVAGGQTMAVDQHDILTSVRFGKGAMKASDTGIDETRTEGIGVIISNNTDLKLSDGEQVVLHMGAAHRNQAYRPVVLSTNDGIENYTSDTDAPIMYTDNNGDLIFSNKDVVVNGNVLANTSVRGVTNPFVTGYLAVWVPVGAESDQDARTTASTEKHGSDEMFRSNAATDSNVIYEGFSNFQAPPASPEQAANVVIAKNVDLFKQWGITSFEFAPQYRSSTDGTFIDSIISNGYAFTDRYDLGFGEPTKYGTDSDLRQALRSLHEVGIQAIADWVPDQVYALPGKEVVAATRVDDHGNYIEGSQINDTLYVANTRGGGKYQSKFGGAFLEELKQKYPQLFQKSQVSTGVPINGDVQIKEWSAKYMNGTNILNRGAGYVLKDENSGVYFNIEHNGLPTQLKNSSLDNAFIENEDGSISYFKDGKLYRNQFLEKDGNWYYFDESGHMVRENGASNNGFVILDDPEYGGVYFFMKNGVSFRNGFMTARDGATYYFDQYGRMIKNQKKEINGTEYDFDKNGRLIK